ncbi:NACHT domain-containing protein [Microbispora rosea]|uniref:NACHT domain-containing protein n=1 Tax=Microbispora rosea TaxID=58117 RepID=UPI00378DF57A
MSVLRLIRVRENMGLESTTGVTMSPRPASEADKVGNRYESAWTVQHLLYVLQGGAESITVEDVGERAEGAEFTLRRAGAIEVHQVKRQQGNANAWTVASLRAKGIWAAAARHAEAGRHFHFVSTIPARPVQELSDRVRRSGSPAEFLEHWLSDDLRAPFDELASANVFGSVETAWKTLRLLWVEWYDEQNLARTNAALAGLLLQGAPGELAAAGLGDLVVQNLGVRLDSAAIAARLDAYGLRRAITRPEDRLGARVRALTAGWIDGIGRQLVRPFIPRAEANELVELLSGSDRLFLVTGPAGGGKSSALYEVASNLGIPALGFRLDRLDAFSSTSGLGELLDLGNSPVSALAAVAGDAPCVLIVDQLDAVSLLSGRMPKSFEVIADLVHEASAFPKMRVVLACRKFDADHDHRIRALADDVRARRVEVAELSDAQVAKSVADMGLDGARLSEPQRRLLRVPLNLALLKSVGAEALSFETTRQLFDAFWRRKLLECRQRNDSVRFQKVVTTLTEAMSERQRLYVPSAVLDEDELAVDADILLSEHVLVRDGQHIAFFHESFFDYAFARGWVTRDQKLVDFLAGGEQELFRRAQVRQIMNHLRELDQERFVREMRELLLAPTVRYHLKEVALVLLGELSAPTALECASVVEVLQTCPRFADRLWLALRTGDWFWRFDDEGLVEEWLIGSDDAFRTRAVEIMGGGVRKHPNRVAEILGTHTAAEAYPGWLRWIVLAASVADSRALFDLVLSAVRQGHYTGAERDLWISVHELGERRPEWALELMAAHLERPDALALNSEGKVSALTNGDHSALELLRVGAQNAPELFCRLFLPYMQRVMAMTGKVGDRPVRDPHFGFRLPDKTERNLDDVLLYQAAAAIKSVAGSDPGTAKTFLEELVDDPHDAAQWLLYQGLAAAGEELASWAAEIMLEGPYRFLSGYVSDSLWTAREVLLAISTSLQSEVFARLETAVLGFSLPHARQNSGPYVFTLLSAMEAGPLSDLGRRRLAELRRAYRTDQPPQPRGMRAGGLRSPIRAEAAERMTDDQWLRAMTKHAEDNSDWQTFTGGASSLAQVLQEKVAQDPVRFARLALRLTREMNPAYANAVLMGLREADRPEHAAPIFDAVRHIAQLRRTENDRWLSWPLSKHLAAVPPDIIEILVDRATSSPDPATDRVHHSDGAHDGDENLHMAAINCARGIAAQALADILSYDADGSRTALVLPHLDVIATDRTVTVRPCAAYLVHAALRHARPQAMHAFQLLIDTDDLLLATQPMEGLMIRLGNEDPEVVRPVVERMLRSATFETRAAGGRIAAFAAMQWGMPELLDAVLNSHDLAQRKGAAGVCAHRLSNTSDTATAERALDPFFDDPEKEVREAAAEVAAALRASRLRPFRRTLIRLLHSAAFEPALPQLLITIEQAPDRVDDLALACARRFIEVHGAQAGDIRFGAAADAQSVSELLIRAYAQAPAVGFRRQILDLLDELLLLDAYGIAEVISASER